MSSGVVCCLSEDFCDGFKINKSTLSYYFPLPLQALAYAFGETTRSLGRSVRFTRSEPPFRPSGAVRFRARVQFTGTYPPGHGPDIDIDGHPHSGIPVNVTVTTGKNRHRAVRAHFIATHPTIICEGFLPPQYLLAMVSRFTKLFLFVILVLVRLHIVSTPCHATN
jgi:hypothetical protein